MKNKIVVYLLLTVVVGIWGFVLYQVFGAVGDNNNSLLSIKPEQVSDQNFDLSYYDMQDTLPLNLQYRDPIYNVNKPSDLEEEEDFSA